MKYLLSVVCSVFLIGCSDSSQTEAPAAPQAETQSAAEPAVSNAPVEAPVAKAEASSPQTQAAPVSAPAAAEPKPAPTKPATPVTAAAAATTAATAASSAAGAATKAASSATAAATKATAAADGATLFSQKCASCHGMKAEKSALGKSQVIAGWSSGQIKDALKGYQAGTYGKEMKALMQGQAKSLNDAQIDAVAKHISSL